MTYRFGPFRADRTTYQVFRDDKPVGLTPKLLDLLFYLLDRPASLVTKEQLLGDVWPGANVTDNALAQAISELREALGDAAGSPTFIRTIARRGYRFIAAVETDRASPGTVQIAPKPTTSGTATEPTIAVLDFSNVTGDEEVAWLATGIAETVTSDLTTLGHFRVADRWRVIQAVRHTSGSIDDVGAALSADLIVSGSFQRSGPNLRITARVTRRATGDSVAEAKVDGQLQDVFSLQDSIVTGFARALGVPVATPDGRQTDGRETSNLDAYRAFTEGWLNIESLDTNLVGQSIKDFEEAVRLDPAYAMAHTGLANAAFVAYEMTGTAEQPDQAALKAGIEHARRAIRLDPKLAEAHATLSFLLVSAGRFDEARAAAEQAVALEPDSWRHQYRLGHASWGTARLRALDRAVQLYPQFSYAHFEATMVHVARGDLELAEDVARQGTTEQDRQAGSTHRFPAIGFHWLLGALALARGRLDEAAAEFERESAHVDSRRLYGLEYGALAQIGLGHVSLARDRAREALASFKAAYGHVAGHPRARLGELAALIRLGDRAGIERAATAVDATRRNLASTDRRHEATYISACASAIQGDPGPAIEYLGHLLAADPPNFQNWTLPLEPSLASLGAHPAFPGVIQHLSQRAK